MSYANPNDVSLTEDHRELAKKKSYKILETAINSALAALVTAKNRRMSIAAAPDECNSAAAAALAGKPAETSAGESSAISGCPRSATAARPRVVASVKGMENQEMPPSR